VLAETRSGGDRQLDAGAEVGAYVLTTASASHHGYLQALGADEIIDYTRSPFVEAIKRAHPEGLDAVFDTVGGQVQIDSAGVLKPGGRLGSILAMQEDYFRQRGVEPAYVFVRPDSEQLIRIRDLAEAGKLKVKLAAVLPLEQAAKAHELIQSGHTEGKIVLKI